MHYKAIIIGGGIGGLAAAACLRREGIDCEVFEQAEELREVGAGLTLWANAFSILKRLGITDRLLQLGSRIDSFETRTASGQVLGEYQYERLAEKLGLPVCILVHRADLLRELAGLSKEKSARCHSRCVGFTENPHGVTASFADGTEANGDFLIGADGLHSIVRSHLRGEEKPRYAGYTCWRGLAGLQPEALRHRGFESWGPGTRFAAQPCGPGRMFWYATRNAPEGGTDSARGRKSEVQEWFKDWHAPIPEIIEATPNAEILRNDIVDRVPNKEWGRGRFTLLGDAAHPMTPNLGQGACQAIEDAVVLADCLRRNPSVEMALRNYERERQPRCAEMVINSWRFGQLSQWEQPVACCARNFLTRCTPSRVSLRLLAKIITPLDPAA